MGAAPGARPATPPVTRPAGGGPAGAIVPPPLPVPLPLPVPAPLVAALERSLAGRRRLVLAVSGGLDSMALLHAVARWRPAGVRVTVATFDHGTGPTARRAARMVRRAARRLGLPVVVGRARLAGADEDAWRVARWRFLSAVAARRRAVVVTAHTRDDQLETVVQRILRGSGPRGLAALLAPSPARRPWLDVPRAALAAWVAVAAVPFVADPSNDSRRHQRNRVRHDLLPALLRLHPELGGELLALGRRAAAWRAAVERVVDGLGVTRDASGSAVVARAALAGYSPGELAVLWPALAGRAGVRLDRRGTRRLAAFTISAGSVGRVPLSGGAEVVVLTDRLIIRVRRPALPMDRVLDGEVVTGSFRFTPADPVAVAADGADLWVGTLPAGVALTVRGWRPGDRILAPGARAARRVKRYLAEAGIPGPLREGWPVVLAAGEIVWIPGVCRGVAATARPGRPALLYVCERIRR
ncbi:MAG: tRNA lysidine(34) synthetase TilS [Gemmatimonadaceae bacterium]